VIDLLIDALLGISFILMVAAIVVVVLVRLLLAFFPDVVRWRWTGVSKGYRARHSRSKK
jgi:hypothetical protein